MSAKLDVSEHLHLEKFIGHSKLFVQRLSLMISNGKIGIELYCESRSFQWTPVLQMKAWSPRPLN